jgi:CysZ protein
MNAVFRALADAAPLVFDRRVLLLVAAPLAGALALGLLAAFTVGPPLTHAFADWIAQRLAAFGASASPGMFATATGAVLSFAIITVGAGALALAAIAVFAGPVFVRAVEARHFPTLERRSGGTMAGSLWNAVVALAIFIPLWLLTLPFLLVPVVGIPLSLVLGAWLNQRLFRYDALAEHAGADELHAVVGAARRRLMGLGLIVAPLALVPVVNLLAPLYAGLAFTCLCLSELAALRSRTAAGGGGAAR